MYPALQDASKYRYLCFYSVYHAGLLLKDKQNTIYYSRAIFPVSVHWTCFLETEFPLSYGQRAENRWVASAMAGSRDIWFSCVSFVFHSIKSRTHLGKDGGGRKHPDLLEVVSVWVSRVVCADGDGCKIINQVSLCLQQRWRESMRLLSEELPIWLGRLEKPISALRCFKMLISCIHYQTPANEIRVTAKEANVMLLKQRGSEQSCDLAVVRMQSGQLRGAGQERATGSPSLQ